MKTLTAKEQSEMRFLPKRNCQNSAVYDAISDLEVAQALFFGKDEWQTKTPPMNAIPSLTYRTKRSNYRGSLRASKLIGKKFSVRTLFDRSGWVVTRIK